MVLKKASNGHRKIQRFEQLTLSEFASKGQTPFAWPSSSCTFHQLCSKRMHLSCCGQPWAMAPLEIPWNPMKSLETPKTAGFFESSPQQNHPDMSNIWCIRPYLWTIQVHHGTSPLANDIIQGAALSFGGELGQRGEVSKNLGSKWYYKARAKLQHFPNSIFHRHFVGDELAFFGKASFMEMNFE